MESVLSLLEKSALASVFQAGCGRGVPQALAGGRPTAAT